MKKNEKGQFIGRGEEVALEILKLEFGEDAEYKIQVPFKDLLEDEWLDTITERQEKETLDIVVFKGDKKIVVRVQDSRHNGFHLSQRDIVQKKTLEWNGCLVVDLYEQECPFLFKDIHNSESVKEVRSAFTIMKNVSDN